MNALLHQVCLHHAAREAVARCPECKHFYCRECITEHDDRIICAACLRKILKPAATKRGAFARLARLGAFGVGVLIAWGCFYFLGRVLLNTSSEFHDGTVWRRAFGGE